MKCTVICLCKAIRVSINPLYFMIPATIGCSYAFMLPVSTPPNSIAFASGHLMVKDMVTNSPQYVNLEHVALHHLTSWFLFLLSQVKTGFFMNILGILSVSLALNTWGIAMFDLNSYPEWAHPINKTALISNVHIPSVNTTL